MPGNAHEIHIRKLGTCPFVAVVIERFDACCLQVGIDFLARSITFGIADLQIDHAHQPGGDGFGPDDPGIIMGGLDDSPDQARHADPVAAHFQGDLLTVGDLHFCTRGF